MPYCIRCGEELAEEASFCGSCGKAITSSTQSLPAAITPAPDTSVEHQPPAEQKAKRSPILWFGGIFFSALFGLIAWSYVDQLFENIPTLVVDPPTITTTAPPIFTTTPPVFTTSPPTQTIPPVTNNPPTITASPSPTQSSTQLISRSYKWSFKGSEWTWELNVPQSQYDYYKALPRPPTENYSVYVTHPYDDPYIDRLVTKIKEAAKSQGYSEFETVEFAAAFVQSLLYTSDTVTTRFDEYPRYPIETLVDNGGDCEDTSILMASIVNAMNYGVVLLVFDPSAGSTSGHIAVGIKGGENVYGSFWEFEGSKYFYLETTGDNWRIGEIPTEYQGSRAYIYDMKPVPVLTHSWTGSIGRLYAEIKIEVTNQGTAEAQGVNIYAGFDAGDNKLWNPEQSQTFTLGPGQTLTVTMTVKVPQGIHTRVVVQIVYGGYAVDQSYSEQWYDT